MALFTLVVLGIGAILGFVLSLVPLWLSIILCSLFSFLFSLAGGYVVFSEFRKREENTKEALERFKAEVGNAMEKQCVAVGQLLELYSKGAAYGVALRIVKEMVPGINNEEQREATLGQVEKIVLEEVEEFTKTVIEEQQEAECQLDTSKV